MASEIKITINAKGVITGGKEVENGLNKIRSSAKQTQSDLEKAVKVDVKASVPQLGKLTNSVTGLGDAVGTFKNLVAGGLIGSALIRGITSAIDESVKLESALIGVNSVAKSFGQNADEVKKAVLDFTKDGLVSATDAALAFKQVLSTGTDIQTAIKLLNSLKDTAAFNRQSFYSLGEAIIATTEGIKNGNSVRADAVGVTKNLSVLEKEYAASIGKTVGQLSDAEKIQARVTGFIREGAFAAGDASKLLDTYSGAMSGLSTAFDRALAKMGSFITESSLVKDAIKGVTAVLNSVALDESAPEYRIMKVRKQLEYLNKEKVGDTKYRRDLEEELRLLDMQINNQKRLSDAVTSRKQAQLEVKKATEESAKVSQEADAARMKRNDTLRKQLIDAGKTELQTLKDVRDRRLADAKDDSNLRLMIEKDYQDKVAALRKKAAAEERKELRDLTKFKQELAGAFTQGASNPFGATNKSEAIKKDPKMSAEFDRNAAIGSGLGVAGMVTQGKAGAQALVSSAAAAGLDAIAPGLGQAAKPLLDAFAQGPDAVKAMVNEFADALPDVIIGFVEAIPVFIETLVDRAPDIIQRLVEKAPAVIGKLVADAPRIIMKLQTMMPKIAFQFVGELIKNIPRVISEAARAIYDALANILGQLNPFGGGGSNNFFSGSADNGFMGTGIHFARGGEVPSSAGTAFRDSVPAVLMGGERVLDRSTNAAFKRFVDEGGSSSSSDVLLARVIQLLEQPMQIQSAVKVDNRSFADILLHLSRTKQRTV